MKNLLSLERELFELMEDKVEILQRISHYERELEAIEEDIEDVKDRINIVREQA